jgi:hypothetical protein
MGSDYLLNFVLETLFYRGFFSKLTKIACFSLIFSVFTVNVHYINYVISLVWNSRKFTHFSIASKTKGTWKQEISQNMVESIKG